MNIAARTVIWVSQNPTTGEMTKIAIKEDCPKGHFVYQFEVEAGTTPKRN